MTAPKSCGAQCVKEYGATRADILGHGEVAYVRLTKVVNENDLVSWWGFRVLARLCGRHQDEATHRLVNPKRDARRFTAGALVGRKTVTTLCKRLKVAS